LQKNAPNAPAHHRKPGQPVQVKHPGGAGQMSDLFDADPFTLVRGLNA
jgi:hypothetical protein